MISSATNMWLPYQINATSSMPPNESYSPLASEHSSSSSSPVSSASSDKQPLSISGFMPTYHDDENAYPTNQHLNNNTNTSTNDNDVTNSSDSIQSSISATSTPTYRSPQSVQSYAPQMYQHTINNSTANFMPYNQYSQYTQNSYFNSQSEFSSYYTGAKVDQFSSSDIKQEVDYPGHSASVRSHENAVPLSNMINNMVGINQGNSYAHAAATAYYNGMNLNSTYYQPNYFNQANTNHTRNNSTGYSSNFQQTVEEQHSSFVKPTAVKHEHQHQVMPSYDLGNPAAHSSANISSMPHSVQSPSIQSMYPNMPKNQTTNPNIKVKLQDMSLWKQFSQIGTEMIITKCGRRMFPSLRVSVSGLDNASKYVMVVDIVPVDDNRYKYHNCEWIVSGKAEAHFVGRGYLHPDSPLTGSQWSKQIISFHKLKLTNNPFDRSGHIILNSMHRYVPRVHIIEEGKSINTFVMNECVFTAVTAYQNELITKLKIEYNPFAKGFRDGQNRQGFRGNTKRGSDDEVELKDDRYNAAMTRMNSGVGLDSHSNLNNLR